MSLIVPVVYKYESVKKFEKNVEEPFRKYNKLLRSCFNKKFNEQ
jgi:hypothetical protein